MPPKFGNGHSIQHYAPELLAGIIFDVYNQHTQIITELAVKLNKWHITIEKLCSKPTETEQIIFKKLGSESGIEPANLKRCRRELSHCASRQLGGSAHISCSKL